MFSQTKQEEPRKTCTQVSACVGFFYHTKKYDWPAEGLIITDMQGWIWPDLSEGVEVFQKGCITITMVSFPLKIFEI
jgi:hypothetical protein